MLTMLYFTLNIFSSDDSTDPTISDYVGEPDLDWLPGIYGDAAEPVADPEEVSPPKPVAEKPDEPVETAPPTPADYTSLYVVLGVLGAISGIVGGMFRRRKVKAQRKPILAELGVEKVSRQVVLETRNKAVAVLMRLHIDLMPYAEAQLQAHVNSIGLLFETRNYMAEFAEFETLYDETTKLFSQPGFSVRYIKSRVYRFKTLAEYIRKYREIQRNAEMVENGVKALLAQSERDSQAASRSAQMERYRLVRATLTTLLKQAKKSGDFSSTDRRLMKELGSVGRSILMGKPADQIHQQLTELEIKSESMKASIPVPA